MSDKSLIPMAVYTSDQRAANESTTGGWVRGGLLKRAGVHHFGQEPTRGGFLIGGLGTAVLCAFGASLFLI